MAQRALDRQLVPFLHIQRGEVLGIAVFVQHTINIDGTGLIYQVKITVGHVRHIGNDARQLKDLTVFRQFDEITDGNGLDFIRRLGRVATLVNDDGGGSAGAFDIHRGVTAAVFLAIGPVILEGEDHHIVPASIGRCSLDPGGNSHHPVSIGFDPDADIRSLPRIYSYGGKRRVEGHARSQVNLFLFPARCTQDDEGECQEGCHIMFHKHASPILES